MQDSSNLTAQLGYFDDEEEETVIAPSGLFGDQGVVSVPDYPAIAKLGRYEILGRLAVGGMAEVYLARERGPGGSRHLVVKRLLPNVADQPEFVQMFLDEARIAHRLYHPNICHVYEGGEHKGRYYMAMEWVPGVTLRRIIRRSKADGGLPIPIAVRVIAQVARALHYVHEARDPSNQPLRIVHRDASPHNIMIRWDGGVRLLDFGIAKAAFKAVDTEQGMVKGKAAYLSPEQCRGYAVDARSDIFTLGIVLFEALTGRPLYLRRSAPDTMVAIAKEPVPSLAAARPDVPVEIDAIVRRALGKRPDDRFQSALQMAEGLEQWLERHPDHISNQQIADYVGTLFEESERTPLPKHATGRLAAAAFEATPWDLSLKTPPQDPSPSDSIDLPITTDSSESHDEIPVVSGFVQNPSKRRGKRGRAVRRWAWVVGSAAVAAGIAAAWQFMH